MFTYPLVYARALKHAYTRYSMFSLSTPFVLASQSPRRKELLARIVPQFSTVPADIDETPHQDETGNDLALRLAHEKARVVATLHPGAMVLAADTVVIGHDGTLLEKPATEAENAEFIRRLSGRLHTVVTGQVVLHGELVSARAVHTTVEFRELPEREIRWYAATGDGLDKAGGYGIQGGAAAFVKRIDGCFFNVMGLSLANLVEQLHEIGVSRA